MKEKNNEMITKINNLMNDNNNLLLLKGQLIKPMRQVKENGEVYYTFILKTLNKYSDDDYSQNYSMFYCVLSTDRSLHYSDEDLKALKNNEVIVVANITGIVKQINAQTGKFYVNSRNSIFVHDVYLNREINRTVKQKDIIVL